jgi:hypothetical protein
MTLRNGSCRLRSCPIPAQVIQSKTVIESAFRRQKQPMKATNQDLRFNEAKVAAYWPVYPVGRNSGHLVVALVQIWMDHPIGMPDSLVAWIGSLVRRLCSILALLRFGDVL